MKTTTHDRQVTEFFNRGLRFDSGYGKDLTYQAFCQFEVRRLENKGLTAIIKRNGCISRIAVFVKEAC